MGSAGMIAGRNLWRAAPGLAFSLALVVSACTPALADDPLEDYKLAVGFYKKEQWKLAADSFQAFLKNHGQHAKAEPARFYYGLTLVKLDDFKQAREVLRNFARDYPKSQNVVSAEYWIGHCSYYLDDFAHAETELGRFAADSPQNPLMQWALPYLADSELRSKKPDAALKHFQQALDAYPQGEMAEDSRFGLARCYEALQKNPEAIAAFKELAANRQGSRAAEAQLSLGELYFKAGDYANAKSAFEAVGKNFPDSPQALQAQLDLGFSLYQLHEYAPAIAQFEKASETARYAAEAQLWKGLCQKSLGEFARASETLRGAYERHRDEPIAEKILFQRALCEDRRGDHERARALFSEVADRWPKGNMAAESLHSAALAAIEGANLPAADALLARFDREFPGNRLRYRQEVLKGRLLAARHDLPGAIRQFQSVIAASEFESTRLQARYHLGFALQNEGHHEQVLAATEPLVQAVSADKEHLEYAGVLVLRGASQLALAKKALGRAKSESTEGAALAKSASESAQAYRDLVPNGPLASQSLLVSAVAEALGRKKDAALANLESLRRNYSRSAEFEQALFDLGTIALSWDDFDWAERLLTELADRPKESRFHAQALADLGWSQHRQKKNAEAAATFARLIDEHPASDLVAEASFQRGVCLEDAGREAEAQAAFAKAAKLPDRPETADPVFLAGWRLGRSLAHQNQIAAADAAFDELLKRFPKRPEGDKVLDEWALVHYKAGQYPRADALFRRLIETYPTSPLADNARLSLAESDLVEGKLEQARPQFEALAASGSADDTIKQRALYQLMEIERESQRWEALRKCGSELLKRYSEGRYRHEAELRLAEADLNLGDFAGAIERLERLKELRSDDELKRAEWFPQVWVLLADAQWRQKDYAAVEATVAEFRDRDPKSPLLYQADELLGKSFKAQAKFGEAREAFERAIKDPHGKLSKTAASSQFLLADTYYWEKDYQTALKEYLKVDILYKFPELQASALYQAGACLEELRQWKQAAKTYDEMLRRFPDSEHAAKAKERLEVTKKRLASG